MKVHEIRKTITINEDDCDLCVIHEKAHELLTTINCPRCDHSIEEPFNGVEESRIVGETNYPLEDESLSRMTVVTCPNCAGYIAMKPIAVVYNGNHDVYYTGGGKYLLDEKIVLNEQAKESIKQFTDRIKSGEDLNETHLTTWLQSNLEAQVAETLKKYGLKY